MLTSAAECLESGAETFRQRNKLYGANYLRFGRIMQELFPLGSAPLTADDWNRLGVIVQCVSKLTRYAENFPRGGHRDSAHDLMVYAAMLEELTDEKPV